MKGKNILHRGILQRITAHVYIPSPLGFASYNHCSKRGDRDRYTSRHHRQCGRGTYVHRRLWVACAKRGCALFSKGIYQKPFIRLITIESGAHWARYFERALGSFGQKLQKTPFSICLQRSKLFVDGRRGRPFVIGKGRELGQHSLAGITRS